MLPRLAIVLAQVKSGNIFGNLLNEIRQIIYSLYREIEITNKVYNYIMNIQQYEFKKVMKQNGYYIYEYSIKKQLLIILE